MKKYDLVIFGLTFSGIGAASSYEGSSLIIEPKTKPGYEFIDSIHPGFDYDKKLSHKESESFKEFLIAHNDIYNTYIPSWTPYVAKWIVEKNIPVLVLTNILDVKKDDDGFVITIFNSQGKSKIFAKKVIDTRAGEFNIKTLNFVTVGKRPKEAYGEKLIGEFSDYSMWEVQVEKNTDYPAARKKVMEFFEELRKLSDDLKLVMIADEFYKTAEEGKKEISQGYYECCSSFYSNPLEAFDMGAMIGGEI